MMTSIWKSGESIYIYFSDKNIVIYPEERLGFEQIFGRVHILPVSQAESGNLFGFMSNYKCCSQQEDNGILLSPHRFSDFVDSLKVLVELGIDGEFKLTQREGANGVKKYIQTAGSQENENETFKYFVEIETIFDTKKYPKEIMSKEMMFEIEPIINEYFFHRFLDRFSLLKDESVAIRFCQTDFEDPNNKDESKELKENEEENSFYNVILKSTSVQANLEGKKIKYKCSDKSQRRPAYQVHLAKSIFSKLFSLLKQQGTSRFGVDHENSVDLVYTFEKAKSISVYLEAASCNL